MILGIGNDVLEVSRMTREIARHGAWSPGEVFTPAELADCAAQRYPARHLAARFAAKEAVLKALGTGCRDAGTFGEAEVRRDPGAAPRLVLHGRLKAAAARLGVARILVSLAHTARVASAFVVLDGDPPATPDEQRTT